MDNQTLPAIGTLHLSDSLKSAITFQQVDTGELIAQVELDGTVHLYKEGAAPEAAKALWGAIEEHGKTLNQRIVELEAEVTRLRTRLAAFGEDEKVFAVHPDRGSY